MRPSDDFDPGLWLVAEWGSMNCGRGRNSRRAPPVNPWTALRLKARPDSYSTDDAKDAARLTAQRICEEYVTGYTPR